MKLKQTLATGIAVGVLSAGLGTSAAFAAPEPETKPSRPAVTEQERQVGPEARDRLVKEKKAEARDRLVKEKEKVCKRVPGLERANAELLKNIDGRIKILEDLKDGSSEKTVKRIDGQIKRLQERKERHVKRMAKLADKCAAATAPAS